MGRGRQIHLFYLPILGRISMPELDSKMQKNPSKQVMQKDAFKRVMQKRRFQKDMAPKRPRFQKGFANKIAAKKTYRQK